MNIMNIFFLPAVLGLTLGAVGLGASNAQAQSRQLDDGQFVSNENTTLEQLTCGQRTVQFARGLRWTPPDYKVQLSVWPAGRSFDSKALSIELAPSCYTKMSCVRHNGAIALLIVDAPACGGNAVPEDYLIFNLDTLKKTTISYAEARRRGYTP